MTEADRKHLADLRAHAKAYEQRHAGARPANPNLPPMGSFAEDFPEQHRRIGERDGIYDAEAEVRVTHKDGTEVVEVWRGISKRHAVGRARDKYGDDDRVARVDFANGEPW